MHNITNARRLIVSRPWTSLLAVLSMVYALYVIYMFLVGAYFENGKFVKGSMGFVHIAVWTICPPAWFFFEYYVLNAGEEEARLKEVKAGQDLAKGFWAAVIALIGLLAK